MECEWGGMFKDLVNLLNQCPILSGDRPVLHRFFDRVSPDLLPGQMVIIDIMFSPSEESVIELGRFFKQGNTIV